ncbi:DUF5694 domain-containing protein [Marixanthomonas ophiurae]|uniref:Uncharacterized protein n=1 Tax=Marixanthomonas ophiurae TaxID=387659 RepID=A0A3E1Q813_9FLAO|nr:DUF5694 domain-containing protein [Marixanthomonas ophiurae]RFN58279.1 hypothetical protein DZ858_13725 [Marixanthomonas ophiurae]
MKNLIFFLTTVILTTNLLSQTQTKKEVFIIGTMHEVPKIVKNSYKPLLKLAVKYNPEAIYVESPRPNDSISWEYLKNGWSKHYKEFYYLSDSLKNSFSFNQQALDSLLKKDFENLTEDNLKLITTSFAYLRDNANYEFYKYIQKHGVEGSKKPTRAEDGDLTAKLALELNIKKLHSMDDQQTNKQYHEAWQGCANQGQTNGDKKINRELNKKDYNRAILPALLGRLGKHVNKRKSLLRLHKLSSFTYVKNETESCTLGTKFWNERNSRMVTNIASQVLSNEYTKNIVIVGAAHVIGLERELKKNYPDISIKLVDKN